MMSSRIEYIDRLKGLAILAVVMGHIIYFVFHLNEDLIWGYIYSFHVPLFIFLSGYVISTPPLQCVEINKKDDCFANACYNYWRFLVLCHWS